MKLVVSHLETSRTYVSREFYYIVRDLIANHGRRHIEICRLSAGPGTITDKLIGNFGGYRKAFYFGRLRAFTGIGQGHLSSGLSQVRLGRRSALVG